METNNKLREAAVKALVSEIGDYSADGLKVVWCGISGNTIKMLRAALAEPIRNCDVGTPMEQAERFDAFCQGNMKFYRNMFGHDDEGRLDGWDCREDCPVGRMIDSGAAVPDHCQLAWAQMPYEEGGDK